ncbi:hypothetical protein BC833DRAFT_585854 [Globomyces pollinis-pini]|nr:hypothetical protein BC833DRAFT_585854 [Globomyces pollinis-pini]
MQKVITTSNDTIKKLSIHSAHLKSQFLHESKRFSREKLKMSDKIATLVKDKAKLPSVMHCINPLPPKQSQKNDLYNIVINNYEQHEKLLLHENSCLRQLLYDCFVSLNSSITSMLMEKDDEKDGQEESDNQTPVLNSNNQEQDNQTYKEGNKDITGKLVDVENGVFQLPFEMMHETITNAFNHNLSILKSFRHQTPDLQTEINNLNDTIAQQQALINQQTQLIELSLTKPQTEFKSDFDVDMEGIEEEWKELKKQKQLLESDRKALTDAAIKIGKERVQLQHDQVVLEEEKRMVAKKNLLSSLPETPQWLKGKTSTQTPATPEWLKASRKVGYVTRTPGHLSSPVRPQVSSLGLTDMDDGKWLESDTMGPDLDQSDDEGDVMGRVVGHGALFGEGGRESGNRRVASGANEQVLSNTREQDQFNSCEHEKSKTDEDGQSNIHGQMKTNNNGTIFPNPNADKTTKTPSFKPQTPFLVESETLNTPTNSTPSQLKSRLESLQKARMVRMMSPTTPGVKGAAEIVRKQYDLMGKIGTSPFGAAATSTP